MMKMTWYDDGTDNSDVDTDDGGGGDPSAA